MEAIRTPALRSQHHSMYQSACKSGKYALARHLSVGAYIEEVQSYLAMHTTSPTELWGAYQKHYQEDLADYANTQAQAIAKITDNFEALDLRTRILAEMADEMTCMPLLARQGVDPADTYDIRAQLIENGGIFGRLAAVTEETLEVTDLSQHSPHVSSLIGLVNELSALSLANIPQDPDVIAVAALPFEDRRYGIDTKVYVTSNTHSAAYGYQVKSNETVPPHTSTYYPRIIGGVAMGNSSRSSVWEGTSGRLQTSLAIVDYAEGILDPQSESVLLSLSAAMVNALRQGRSFVDTKNILITESVETDQ